MECYSGCGRRGFSIIEFSLVIIILGVVFLFGLQGASTIPVVRSQIAAHQIENMQAAILAYLTDYGSLPGDDPRAVQRWKRPDAVFVVNGRPISYVGDGEINGDFEDPGNATGEQYTAWRDLRWGGYLSGDPTLVGQSAQPENPFGGTFGFAQAALGIPQALCLTRVPGEDARRLDTRFDDGKPGSGRFRATSATQLGRADEAGPAPGVEPYNADNTYIICLPQLP